LCSVICTSWVVARSAEGLDSSFPHRNTRSPGIRGGDGRRAAIGDSPEGVASSAESAARGAAESPDAASARFAVLRLGGLSRSATDLGDSRTKAERVVRHTFRRHPA
jgi:hypothetical protein